MKRLGVLLLAAALIMVPLRAAVRGRPIFVDYIYPPAGTYDYTAPELIGRISKILDAVDSPQRRSELAESWLQFSRQVITKNQQLQEQWLEFQRYQLRQQQQVEQLRMEVAKLQMRVEELRAENLRLEQDNLLTQLRRENQDAAQRKSVESPPAPLP